MGVHDTPGLASLPVKLACNNLQHCALEDGITAVWYLAFNGRFASHGGHEWHKS